MSAGRQRSASTQRSQPRDRQRVQAAEAVGQAAQLTYTREAVDQTADRGLDLRTPQPLEHGNAPTRRGAQQRLEPVALLAGGRLGEHHEAARVRVLTRGADQPPQRAVAGQQDAACDQVLSSPCEEHAVALGAHQRPRAQPQRDVVLDAVVAERPVAVGAANLGLVLPARLALSVARKIRSRRDADLAARPGQNAARNVGGVPHEAAEVADRAELHREPEATGVPAPRRDPAAVVVGEEEAARQFVRGQLSGESAVVLGARSADRGREAQHAGVRCHGSISRASIAAWRSAADGRL